MNFGGVIQQLQIGGYLTRAAWPNLTYIFLDGEIIRYSNTGIDYDWVPSHIDLMANDWDTTLPRR